MDLIYTNANKVDLGIIPAYSFDLSYGADENDFEITVATATPLESGAFVYIDGTEYGGTVDGLKAVTGGDTVTYNGRTWHGMLNSKVIQPNSGEDHLVLSGDANEVLAALIALLGLSGLFVVAEELSGVNISGYQFPRYCKGYDGIRGMLAKHGAKLNISWADKLVCLSAVPIANYTEAPIDSDIAHLTVERHENKVNHLICLGKGELAEREVVHLYVDQFGGIGKTQYFTGVSEITEVYDNSNSDNLEADGIEKLKELLITDKAEIDIPETENLVYDIGDIVGASDITSGITVAETVTQKIVKIKNGVITTEYKTGAAAASKSGSASGTGGGASGGGITSIPVATETTLGAVKIGSNLAITGDGTLSVVTTNNAEQDNTKPITSAGVYTQLGNIEVLLAAL